MAFSRRKFIVRDDGTLVRLRSNIFDRLLVIHSMPEFAGKRVRMADIIVEMADWRPRSRTGRYSPRLARGSPQVSCDKLER
jgi:hypothetical protein